MLKTNYEVYYEPFFQVIHISERRMRIVWVERKQTTGSACPLNLPTERNSVPQLRKPWHKWVKKKPKRKKDFKMMLKFISFLNYNFTRFSKSGQKKGSKFNFKMMLKFISFLFRYLITCFYEEGKSLLTHSIYANKMATKGGGKEVYQIRSTIRFLQKEIFCFESNIFSLLTHFFGARS